MSLTNDDKLLLAIYYELFHKKYDIKESDLDENDILVRYTQMQEVVFLLTSIGIIDKDKYCFSGTITPYSIILLNELNELEHKGKQIDEFYIEYKSNQTCDKSDILKHKKTLRTFYLIDNIMRDTDGLKYFVIAINLVMNQGNDITSLTKLEYILNLRGITMKNEYMLRKIWSTLHLLDILDINNQVVVKTRIKPV